MTANHAEMGGIHRGRMGAWERTVGKGKGGVGGKREKTQVSVCRSIGVSGRKLRKRGNGEARLSFRKALRRSDYPESRDIALDSGSPDSGIRGQAGPGVKNVFVVPDTTVVRGHRVQSSEEK